MAILMTMSCRSEYERVRTEGTAMEKLAAADDYFAKGDYTKAIALYEAIIPLYRGKKEAQHIAYNYAEAHYLDGSYLLSGHYFQKFSETYDISEKRQEALYKSALSYDKMSPRYQLDQDETLKAMDAFQKFVNAYPTSEYVEECNQRIDALRDKQEQKAFEAGKLYYLTGNYGAAIQSLENMLKDFPDAKHQEEARRIIVLSSKDWADNSVFSRKEERYRKTVERCDQYLKKHSGQDNSQKISSIKQDSEKELKKIQNG